MRHIPGKRTSLAIAMVAGAVFVSAEPPPAPAAPSAHEGMKHGHHDAAAAAQPPADAPTTPSQAIADATAVMLPTANNKVSGTIRFTATPEGTRIVADLRGLTPGKHGFHIHEFGDCSAPDAASAGGHFNPGHEPHGSPDAAARHKGDMGNITADANGIGRMDIVDRQMTLTGEASILGRGVIVHEKEDDLATQPTGNAGPRVACGVVGVAKPAEPAPQPR